MERKKWNKTECKKYAKQNKWGPGSEIEYKNSHPTTGKIQRGDNKEQKPARLRYGQKMRHKA